jgi:mRNA interferase MazF
MAHARTVEWPRRGEVYRVSFDPALGSEVRKTRPAVVLQNDVANRWSPVTIVAAVTSKFDEQPYPTEVVVRPPEGGLSEPSVILLNQVRTVDRRRLVKRLGRLRPETLAAVDRALQISLGLLR